MTIALQQACNLDDERACELLAAAYTDVARHDDARVVNERLCTRGNWGACDALAFSFVMYPPKDPVRAAQLYEKACQNAHAKSCNHLGIIYERAWVEGAPSDKIEALYTQACDAGVDGGCHNLAIFYLRPGPAHDEARAVSIFERLCERNYQTACVDLGDRLSRGRGVAIDKPRGQALLKQACDQRNGYGCAFLGRALFSETSPTDTAQRKEAIHQLMRGCSFDSPRSCEWAADFANETPGVLEASVIAELYPRAFRMYSHSCIENRHGRNCAMAAMMLGEGKATPATLTKEDLIKLACTYDDRTCDWNYP